MGNLFINGQGSLPNLDYKRRPFLVHTHSASRNDPEWAEPMQEAMFPRMDKDNSALFTNRKVCQGDDQWSQMLLVLLTTISWRDGLAMWTGGRVAKKGTDTVGYA